MAVIGPRLLAFVLLLGGVEWSLSLAGYGHWTVNERSARYGWKMLPNQKASSRDLSVPEFINSQGFRDRDWAPLPSHGLPHPDPSLFRIALLGNSMTFGTSVSIEETYGRVLEEALAKSLQKNGDSRTVEVMNFAVQGYVFEQMARVYEDKIRPYAPDLLIVPVHPHDIVPMAPAEEDPDYALRTYVLRTATHDFLNRVVTGQWIPHPRSSKNPEAREHQRVDDAISFSPFKKDHAPYWQVWSNRLLGIAEDISQRGGRVVVVNLPRWRKMLQPELMEALAKIRPLARNEDAILAIDPVPVFTKAMKTLVDEIQSKSTWLVAETGEPLSPAFSPAFSDLRWAEENGTQHHPEELIQIDDMLFFVDDIGHYSNKGHRLLGKTIAKELVAAGWTAPPRP